MCQRPGCGNRTSRAAAKYCSTGCRFNHQRKPRPICKSPTCEQEVPRPDWTYCSKACRPSGRGLCGKGIHPRPQFGPCKECRSEWERTNRPAGRARDAAGVGRSKPQPPPAPALPQAPTATRPVGVWRLPLWDAFPARGGPGDPATRRDQDGAAGDATPVGVSASADDTVDPDEELRSA